MFNVPFWIVPTTPLPAPAGADVPDGLGRASEIEGGGVRDRQVAGACAERRAAGNAKVPPVIVVPPV